MLPLSLIGKGNRHVFGRRSKYPAQALEVDAGYWGDGGTILHLESALKKKAILPRSNARHFGHCLRMREQMELTFD